MGEGGAGWGYTRGCLNSRVWGFGILLYFLYSLSRLLKLGDVNVTVTSEEGDNVWVGNRVGEVACHLFHWIWVMKIRKKFVCVLSPPM